MSGLVSETFGQVDDGDGLKWTFSNTLSATNTKDLRDKGNFTSFGYFNADLTLLVERALLCAFL